MLGAKLVAPTSHTTEPSGTCDGTVTGGEAGLQSHLSWPRRLREGDWCFWWIPNPSYAWFRNYSRHAKSYLRHDTAGFNDAAAGLVQSFHSQNRRRTFFWPGFYWWVMGNREKQMVFFTSSSMSWCALGYVAETKTKKRVWQLNTCYKKAIHTSDTWLRPWQKSKTMKRFLCTNCANKKAPTNTLHDMYIYIYIYKLHV